MLDIMLLYQLWNYQTRRVIILLFCVLFHGITYSQDGISLSTIASTEPDQQVIGQKVDKPQIPTLVSNTTAGDNVTLVKLLADIQKKLTNQVLERPGSRPELITLAKFHLFVEDPQSTWQILQVLGEADQNDVQHPLISAETAFALGDYLKTDESLKTALERLSGQLPLQVSNPVFCRRIIGYRLYETRPIDTLRPGMEALVYVEIRNAMFQKIAGSQSVRCDLGIDLKIFNSKGSEVFTSVNHGDWKETYQGRVNDLHLAIYVRLPANLTADTYRLTVVCNDRFSKNNAVSETTFAIGSASPTSGSNFTLPPLDNDINSEDNAIKLSD